MGDVALLCPGQGAQRPGFIREWLSEPVFRAAMIEFGDLAELDLAQHGAESGAETIRDTAVAQPLIVGASLAAARLLTASDRSRPEGPTVIAGHSVGEVAASALAGVLSERDALRFVAERGRAMRAAASSGPRTGMSAVIGGDEATVLAALEKHGLFAANRNGAGQIVAAGRLDALADLGADPPDGARIRALPVAGAFHTPYMMPATAVLEALAGTLAPAAPGRTLLSNADGAAVADGRGALDGLVSQVSRPVRWDLCLSTMRRLHLSAIIELPPAGVLTGLVRRELPGVPVIALRGPADLEAARHALRSAVPNAA